MNSPLADRIRPDSLDAIVGQIHLLGEGKVLRNILETGNIPNMIFYGPSGTGKTTVANIAALRANKRLYRLNATNASVADIKAVVNDAENLLGQNGVLLYLDEIQNFNKKQQQSLLECIETGKVTLIAATTENPYFYVYNAILSRSTVFEFLPVDAEDIEIALTRAVDILTEEYNLTVDTDALRHIADTSAGDVRKALNTLEISLTATRPDSDGAIHITLDTIEETTAKKAFRHDRDGDSHYDVLSALQKSVRGSDADAALHYAARLLAAGDLASLCRRILVIAAEDVGLAYPQAITVTKACVDAALQLGLPEARIPLAEAVILLSTAPKSNSVICAIDEAMHDVENTQTGDIPLHLKDSHYSGAKKLGRGEAYKYPHNYADNYIEQQYLPDKIKGKKYYKFGNNKNEQAARAYWSAIKERKNLTKKSKPE
ncbi:MAG: replication-associated recombination protein A [Clostridia bacterium]|nr:replication-associated recombination protein A [Clostridia bacterium]